jgi:excisionase family DNA binding protein
MLSLSREMNLMKKNNIELSVKEASEMLGVTTRSILNYIKAKEIMAVKVGKSWFIKEPSLISFSKKYKLGDSVDPQEKAEKQGPTENSLSGSSEMKKNKPFIRKNPKKKQYIINTLKLYEIATQAFSMKKWQELEKIKVNELSLPMQRIRTLKLDALELVGAGYYSFNKKEKRNLYNQSREKIGAILALLYIDLKVKELWSDEVYFIENQLLAAYSSLIRKMEKTNEKQ